MKTANAFAKYRITDASHFKLSAISADAAAPVFSKKKQKHAIKKNLRDLADLQELLYAENTWSLLLVLQGMDASGKDGTIKHVMRGVNPQGCHVVSFKQPSHEELNHDFLWRCARQLPERGHIGIFNRSYYEEVLVVRVHPEILDNQRLPDECRTKHLWKERYEDITCFERHLARNGTKILKFFLHISPDEQRARLLARLDDKEKNWKFEPSDLAERAHWDQYTAAFEEMIRHTSTPEAPWHVIPANNKLQAHYLVSTAILDALREMKLATPRVGPEKLEALKKARKKLAA